MKIKMFAVVVLGAVAAANAQVNFDKGVDAKSFADKAVSAGAAIPQAKSGIPMYSSRDCKKVEFTPESPLTSADVTLRATETYQDCFPAGPYGQQVCIPRTEWHTETTRVIVTEPRELKEGQKEVFEVCLWGQFLSLSEVSTVYKYKTKVTFNGIYVTPKGPKAELPATKGNNMWQVLSKIKLNDKQPDMNETLVGLVDHSAKIDTVVKELNEAGFRVKPYQDNMGGYMVMAEVAQQEASDRAIGLARYYYISQVQVGERVYRDIFPKN